MASSWPPKKNAAFTLYFTLYKNDGTVIADPGTITKKVSIDGAAVADIAAAVTEEDTTYGRCSVVLAAGEMNGDAIWGYIVDNTPGCVPFTFTIYTAAQTLDELDTVADSILSDTGTDGVKLADDAITSAKFDESTAFPLKSADTGATILARAGAKMDLVDAPNATALGAIKDAVQGAGTTLATLLSRIIGTLATGTHNPQTGDAYARLGAAGAGLTALGDARLANLDAAVSGREASGAAAAAVVGLSTFNPATDEVDVGKVKGVGVTDIDDFKADVSGLSTLTAGDLPSEPPSAGTIADAVWDEAAADHVSAGTFGKLMLAFKTLLGHKSIENSESTSVTFRTAGDAGDAGTQSWDEDNKTRGEYTGF